MERGRKEERKKDEREEEMVREGSEVTISSTW